MKDFFKKDQKKTKKEVNLNNNDAVTVKTLLTIDSNPTQGLLTAKKTHDGDGQSEKQDSSMGSIRDRKNSDFDPFSTKSAYKKKRPLSLKWFGNMKAYSLRRGSIGLASVILGTGILALPQGIAEYGWVSGLIMISVSACCHLYSFYLLAHTQALAPKSDSYTEMVGRVIGNVSLKETTIFCSYEDFNVKESLNQPDAS